MDLLKNVDWELLKSKLREAIFTLPHFLKNPIEGMKNLPHWGWAETLILQACFAAICGVLKSLVERNWLGAFFSIILTPLSALLMTAIFCGLFFYIFYFFFNRQLSFHRLYIHFIFASIPIMITSTISYFLPPINLLGVVTTALLLFVGFCHEFALPREKVKKLLAIFVLVYLVIWISQLIQLTSRKENFRMKATPESLDILEKDMQKQND
jgi:hypothetical protein